MDIKTLHSSHFDDREDGKDISCLIMHYTEIPTYQAVEDIFLGRAIVEDVGRVSAHYVVDVDGGVVQFVPEDKRAWHAGRSYWRGEIDVNSTSIGIEIVHPGHNAPEMPYPSMQIQSVIDLSKDIISRHNIEPSNVLGHSDIAPDRKRDPGEFFPWRDLNENGVGVLMDEHHVNDTELNIPPDFDVKQALTQYGYDPAQEAHVLIEAFQRRFEPDVFDPQSDKIPGVAAPSTLAILSALIDKASV